MFDFFSVIWLRCTQVSIHINVALFWRELLTPVMHAFCRSGLSLLFLYLVFHMEGVFFGSAIGIVWHSHIELLIKVRNPLPLELSTYFTHMIKLDKPLFMCIFVHIPIELVECLSWPLFIKVDRSLQMWISRLIIVDMTQLVVIISVDSTVFTLTKGVREAHVELSWRWDCSFPLRKPILHFLIRN